MIHIQELLEDPVYKKYFTSVPKMANNGRWRLYVLDNKDSKWKKRDFDTYVEAFRGFKKLLKAGRVRDAAITSLGQSFAPPKRWVRIKGKYVVGSDGQKRQAMKQIAWAAKIDPMDEHHDWCVWCRRPIVMRFYRRHHALKGISIDSSVRRCAICGASERVQTHG